MIFFRNRLHIDESLKSSLAKAGLLEFQDFMNYSAGTLVSRSLKERHVRTLCLEVAGQTKKYFLKQSRNQSFRVVLKALSRLRTPRLDTVRERFLLELFRDQGIPVMVSVAWGQYTVLGWPVRGFILVEEVVGREFTEVYRDAPMQTRRRLMRVHGELMGTLHRKGIESKVHPRDLICVSHDYSSFRKCLVVIDRERGATHSGEIALKKRGKALAEIWVKAAFSIGRGERIELLAFLSGYFAASGMHGVNKDMRGDLVNRVLGHAKDILARDVRFASLRPDFKEKYGVSSK